MSYWNWMLKIGIQAHSFYFCKVDAPPIWDEEFHTCSAEINGLLYAFLGLFIWRKVVFGRRVALSPEPSFTERLYEKSCPCQPSQNLTIPVSRMLYMSQIVPDGRVKHRHPKKVSSPPRVTQPSKRVTLHPGSPWPFKPNFVISHVNSLLLFVKKCMKGSLALDGSIWRVTLLPGRVTTSTFSAYKQAQETLHISLWCSHHYKVFRL